MPLTPAHAAAVIPLRRWKARFWLSPLIVGSMAPDFMYYIFPPQDLRHFGHTPLGLIAFCVPVGLAVLLAFHAFFKRPLVLLMPLALREKLWPLCGRYPILPLRRLLWICVLIYLGAVTHVLWDGVTHEDGWAVRDNPPMQEAILTVLGHEIHICRLLQYVSSVGGLGLLAWWSWRWYRTAPAGRAPDDWPLLRIGRPIIVTGMVFFGLTVGIGCGLNYVLRLPGAFAIREFFAASFITGADAFVLALVVFSVLASPARDERARN
jgi:hypothetical protein